MTMKKSKQNAYHQTTRKGGKGVNEMGGQCK